MEFLKLSWALLLLVSLGVNIWIVGIQGFNLNESAVQRCSEKGGACEQLLMSTEYDLFGIMPSILSFAMLSAALLLFLGDLQLGFLEIALVLFLGLGSLYFIGVQLLLRRYCDICNFFHAAILALAVTSAFIVFGQPLKFSSHDLLFFGFVFLSIVAGLHLASKLHERVEDQQQSIDLFRTCLRLQDYRTLTALRAGQPCAFPEQSLIDLISAPDTSKPEAVLALTHGCDFCAETLEWVLGKYPEISQYWNIRIVFVDTIKSHEVDHSAIDSIKRSCDALKLGARLSYMRVDVLPFLQGQHKSLERLNKAAGPAPEQSKFVVPILPFAPALCVEGVFLNEDINFPKDILSVPMANNSIDPNYQNISCSNANIQD